MLRVGTIGELRAAGYQVVPVREEMRRNLLRMLARGERMLPGLIGYDETVIPEIENAVLAGHHIVFLGERGQGKSRIMRGLLSLLDEAVPVIEHCEINDDPFAPICKSCRRRVEEQGDAVRIVWLERDRRYGEKLATPDVAMADLIGEIDPVKVAEGRYLGDEDTIHYGLVPRTHRGIFAINELPDLTEKVQVGLFNVMEEKDIQIRGYKIRLPIDVVLVASANPEDYTSRGRIVTPLKDRFDAQIRTHYPMTLAEEIAIMEQEVPARDRDGRALRVPEFLKELLAGLTMEARKCSDISQTSGVSVRVTINNYESVISNAEKRAVRCGEQEIVPRISDLHAILASTTGKIELEYGGREQKEGEIVERLLDRAMVQSFDRVMTLDSLKRVMEYFERGGGVEVSDRMPAADYLEGVRGILGLREAILMLGPFESPGLMAAATEFLLEGLHVHRKLNKESTGGRYTYKS